MVINNPLCQKKVDSSAYEPVLRCAKLGFPLRCSSYFGEPVCYHYFNALMAKISLAKHSVVHISMGHDHIRYATEPVFHISMGHGHFRYAKKNLGNSLNSHLRLRNLMMGKCTRVYHIFHDRTHSFLWTFPSINPLISQISQMSRPFDVEIK